MKMYGWIVCWLVLLCAIRSHAQQLVLEQTDYLQFLEIVNNSSSAIACTVASDAGTDITACSVDFPVQLNGMATGDTIGYFWTPAANLSDPSILNPTASAPGIYTLTVEGLDDVNLVTNGDFELGDTGFTTDYSTGIPNVGNYLITDDPTNYYIAFSPCGDHTTGTGEMMVVDGSVIPGDNIWCQTIPVSPNTDYNFSLWATMVGGTSPPELLFVANGTAFNTSSPIPLTNCTWTEISGVWNSGTSTSLDICIQNENTSGFGNDFAIDDIMLNEICIMTDEVVVTGVEAVADVAAAQLACPGDCIFLDGSNSTTGTTVSYQWIATNGGSIQSGETTLSPEICEAGTYTLEVTNEINSVICSDSYSIIVTVQDTLPLEPTFDGLATVCDGDVITYSITSTDPNTDTYNWTITGGDITTGVGTSIDVDWTGSTGGEVCVEASNVCDNSVPVCLTITVDNLPALPIIAGPASICNTSVGIYSIPLDPDIISYNWTVTSGATISLGQNTESVEVDWGTLMSGQVCLEITNTCGPSNDCFNVILGAIQSDVIVTQPTCSGVGNGSAVASGSGGLAPYSFLWENGSVLNSIDNLSSGTYLVTVTDDDGCTTIDSAVIVDPVLLEVTLSNTAITCNSSCDGTITSTVTGGTPPFTYSWTGSTATTPDLTGLCENTYEVLVTDSNMCTATAQIILTDPPLITAGLLGDATICLGDATDIILQLSGVGPFDVTLSDGTVLTNINDGEIIPVSPTMTTIFSITNVVDLGQPTCTPTIVNDITITVNTPPISPIIIGDDEICQGEIITYCVTADPNVMTWNWIVPNDATFTGQGTSCIDVDWTGSAGGQICIDAINDCATIQTCIPITVNPVPTSDFTVDPNICMTDSTTVTYSGSASPNATYTWNFDGGNILSGSGEGPYEIQWTNSGTYNITLTVEENGCTSTMFSESVQVDAEIPPVVVNCTSTTNTITFTWDAVPGATSYTVVDISGTTGTQTGNEYFVNNLLAGQWVSIEVTASGPTICGDVTTAITCAALACPSVTVAVNPVSDICLDGNATPFNLTATLTGDNGLGTSTWVGNGITDATLGTFDPVLAGAGIHNIVYTYEENGCPFSEAININVYSVPTSDFTVDAIICENDFATITYIGSASSSATYTWDFDGGTIISGTGVGPYEVEWTTSGIYNITLTVEENGCTSQSTTMPIQVDSALPQFTVNCTSTTSSVTFTWNAVPGATSYSVTSISGQAGVLTGTTYEVTGLAVSEQVMIEVTAEGTSACGNVTIPASCTADNCPTITIAVDAVSDTCFDTSILPFNLTQTTTGSDGTGTGSWSGNGITDATLGTFDVSVAGVGTHMITYTFDENNCSYTGTIDITINGIPTSDFTLDAIICENDFATITYIGSASSSATYTWDFDGGTILSGTGVGPYEVEWTNSGTYNITLTVEENDCISEFTTMPIQVDSELPQFTVSCTSTTSSVTFTWDPVPGATSYSITSISGQVGTLTGTTYEVTGLAISEQVMIEVIADGTSLCGNVIIPASCAADNCPIVTVDVDAVSDTCFDASILPFNLTQTTTGSDGSGTGSWSGNGITDATLGTFDVSVAGVGTHTITYTFDENSCSYTGTTDITIHGIPTSDFTVDAIICENDFATITYTGSANPSATYTWDFDGGTILSGSGPGSYEVEWTTSGTYNITLTVEENGCISQSTTMPIQVDAELPQFTVNCTTTTSSVTFMWDAVPGATSYSVINISGQAGVLTGTTYEVTGLALSEQVIIEVTAEGISSCGNVTIPANCEADNCPAIGVVLTPVNNICLESNTASVLLEETVTGSNGSGVGIWSGNGVTNNMFDPVAAGVGAHNITFTFSELLCDFTETMTINVFEIPIANAGMTQHLSCSAPFVQLSGSSSIIGNYTWTTSNGNILTGENTLTPEVNAPGTYIFTTESNGCSTTDEVIITEDPSSPMADAGLVQTITCDISCVTLGGNGTSTGTQYSYSWTGPNGFVSNEINPEVCESGEYILVVFDDVNICQSPPSNVTILLNDTPPSIDVLPFGNLDCIITAILLDGSNSSTGAEFTYQWYNDNGIINNATSPIYEALVEGNYTLIITNTISGCTSESTVQVEDIVAYPDVVIAQPDELTCDITTITLDGTGSTNLPQITYQWTGPTGGIISGENSSASQITLPGSYTLTLVNGINGCQTSETINVTQDVVPPIADAGQDVELECNEFNAIIGSKNTSIGNNFTYQWSSDNPNALYNNPTLRDPVVEGLGTYTLTVTNIENGCTAIDEMIIAQSTNIPTDVVYDIFDLNCFGDDDGAIIINDVVGGTPPYLFSLDESPYSSTNSFSDLTPGNYNIIIQDANGCELPMSVPITEPEEVTLELGENTTIEFGDSIMLNPQMAGDIQNIVWTPNNIFENCIDGINCFDPLFYPQTQTTVSATVMDGNGCTATDLVTIFVEKNRYVYIPNAFSPNGNDDSENEVFMIYTGKGVEKINNFRVFTRWGELVHEAKEFVPGNLSHGWDGTFNGQHMNPGVYIYMAEVEFTDGLVELYKGDVTLVK